MKKTIFSLLVLFAGMMASCSDDMDLVIPHATNITFSELQTRQRICCSRNEVQYCEIRQSAQGRILL